MDRDVVIQIIEGKVITQNQLNDFIVAYTENQLGRTVTGEELSGILQLLRMGTFNLRFAATKVAKELDLSIINVFDKNNMFIRSYVYDGN